MNRLHTSSAPGPEPCAASVEVPQAQATDSRIAIDDFMKVELRVAKVLEAEAVPKSKKLREAEGGRGDRTEDHGRRHCGGVSTDHSWGGQS